MSLNDRLDQLRDSLSEIRGMLVDQSAILAELASDTRDELKPEVLRALRRRLSAHARELEAITGADAPPTSEGVRAMSTKLDDVLKRIDDDTTAVAAKVTELRDKVTTSMTQADVDAVHGQLDAIAGRLEATAADPVNPVPPGPVPNLAAAPSEKKGKGK